MTQLNMLFGALFRPRATFSRLAEGVKWVWLPALIVLVVASLANVAATVPLQMKAQTALAKKQEAKVQAEMAAQQVQMGNAGPSAGAIPADQIIGPAPGEDATGNALAMTAGLVFGVVGVVVSLLACTTFFFVAGKVWAKSVRFGTFLSIMSLAAMPLAARDIMQAVAQTVTGRWIQHQGLSALVAAKDAISPTGAAYGLLMQIDVWAIWALVLVYVGITAAAGFERKRALIGLGIFTVLAVLLRAAPAIVTGVFAGPMG
jgi:hypothetical protein